MKYLKKEDARELGEAMIDAAEAVATQKQDQQVILLGGKAVAIPYDPVTDNSIEAYESAGGIVKYCM